MFDVVFSFLFSCMLLITNQANDHIDQDDEVYKYVYNLMLNMLVVVLNLDIVECIDYLCNMYMNIDFYN